MPEVVVAAGRRVAAHDVLAVDLRRHGDVLADGQAEHVLGVGQRKPVAARARRREGGAGVSGEHGLRVRAQARGGTHIAVLGEMTIFSLSGNSFQTWGSSTGFLSARRSKRQNAVTDVRNADTYSRDQT